MPLPPSFLDDLRARLPISEVVGRRLKLTRAGREWKACCPFHKEKTPSFTVSDDKGFFHCFGCGAHGDVLGFVMRHDHLSFMEAVEQLAARAGLPVPQASPEERVQAERQKGLYELVETACVWFESQLHTPAGRAAQDYLVRRGLDDDTIARFRLGYAPADSRALLAHLKGEGFDEAQIIEAGLARRPDDGRAAYAFFRHRILFPVTDRRGRVIAFGGRLMEGDGPKYINSPDTPLFHKGRLLYGLARARGAADQGHGVIVAEGYMDVIALVRAGFDAAVAPLGTALTEAQVAELWRLAPLPVLCFDGDDAGRRAAWRAVDRILPILEPDHSVAVAFLPAGEDPDSLLRGPDGVTAMKDVLAAARPLADVVWEREVQQRDVSAPEGRAGLKAALLAQAHRIADRTVQRFYVSHFNNRVFETFFNRAQRIYGGKPEIGLRRGSPVPRRPKLEELETQFLVLALLHPDMFAENEDFFIGLPGSAAENTELRRLIFDILANDPETSSADLIERINARGSWQATRLIQKMNEKPRDYLAMRSRYMDPEKARAWFGELVEILHRELLMTEMRARYQTLFEGPWDRTQALLHAMYSHNAAVLEPNTKLLESRS